MRITILTFGSRGDAAPLIRLGEKLQDKGHEVTILATTDSKELIEQSGLKFHSAQMNTRAVLKTDLGQQLLAAQGNGLKALIIWRNLVKTHAGNLRQMFEQASQDADLIIFTLSTFAGHTVAEKMGIPSIAVSFFPITPTKAFPVFMFKGRLGGQVNRFSYRIFEFLYQKLIVEGENINSWREELGLAPYKNGPFTTLRASGVPQLYPFSPAIFPKQPEWSANTHVTGYWHLDEPGWQPTQALLDFLEKGSQPVYFGFGSMAIQKPLEVTKTILEALAKTGQRAILSKGWAGIGEGMELPATVFLVDAVSHDWLFQRVSAVVHHGGVGTTHSSLRAGRPTLIVPFTTDQPMWGATLHRYGMSPKPIPITKLTSDKLAKALLEMKSENMIERARQVGVQVRSENAADKAVAVIEQALLNQPVPSLV